MLCTINNTAASINNNLATCEIRFSFSLSAIPAIHEKRPFDKVFINTSTLNHYKLYLVKRPMFFSF